MNPDGGANGSVLRAGGLRVLDLPGAIGVELAAVLRTAGVELGIPGNVLGSGIGAVGTNPPGVTGEGFGAGIKPAGGERVGGFEMGTNPKGLGVGIKPAGGESGLGLEAGMNPAGGETGDLGVVEVVAEAEVCCSSFRVWEASTFATVLFCTGPEMSFSSDFSTGFTPSFSAGSSLRIR